MSPSVKSDRMKKIFASIFVGLHCLLFLQLFYQLTAFYAKGMKANLLCDVKNVLFCTFPLILIRRISLTMKVS